MYYASLFSAIVSICLLLSPLEAKITSQTSQSGIDFIPPSERYVMDTPMSKITKATSGWGIDAEYKEMFKHIIAEEKEGFMGYNGGSREFRIYQDVIRFALEEILNIPIRPDFYFLRIPGDPLLNVNSAAEFLKKNANDINNGYALQAQQLFSMNSALYGNYDNGWESSMFYFVNNWIVIKQDFENRLIPFFTKLGVDPTYIHQAFEIARARLSKKGGYLLQLFDYSNYELADAQIYLALAPSGRPINPIQPISAIMLNQANHRFPQMRLILNNKYTVNPNSSLVMKRYDTNSPETTQLYEQEMRGYFQTLPVDIYQKEIYKQELQGLWELTPSEAYVY